MQVFITGTDTSIGKTLISSWLCLHTGFDYFKPIQTGCVEGRDIDIVRKLSNSKIHKELYEYQAPLSPHLAASLENSIITMNEIKLPTKSNLIIEGAGGLMVPLNQDNLMIDLIKFLSAPVILVTSSKLGTINHTLLSIEALRAKNIQILGVIICGEQNSDNAKAIEFYGKVEILAEFPNLYNINKETLENVPLTDKLKQIFGV